MRRSTKKKKRITVSEVSIVIHSRMWTPQHSYNKLEACFVLFFLFSFGFLGESTQVFIILKYTFNLYIVKSYPFGV